MSKTGIIDLYQRRDDRKYDEFCKNISSSVKIHTDIKRTIIDTEWIDEIEKTIPYIDNILRNPNRFIINEEDLVKIELARKITVESIKHLSRNTNLIQDYDEKTQDVRPSKILNINKEESFDTYENKFIYSLIQNTRFFLERKKGYLELYKKSEEKNDRQLEYTGTSKIENEEINVRVSLNTKLEENTNNELEEIGSRLEKIDLKLKDLTTSEVYKIIEKKHISLVTSPIKKTNVILKNVNFQYALKLWNYIQDNIEDQTKEVKENMDFSDEDRLKNLTDESFFLQYLIINNSLEENEDLDDAKENRQINDIMINKLLENMMERDLDVTLRELKSQLTSQFEKIKYRNRAARKEIENIFKKQMTMYLDKVNQK